jgi:hypothetical protein
VIDYGRLEPDALVEHLIDENGLADFLEIQQSGIALEDWDWREITLHLQAFSRGHLTFSPDYLQALYALQCERREVAAA